MVIFEKSDLAAAAAAAAAVTPSRATIPVLSHLRLIASEDRAAIEGTDLTRWVRATAPADGAINVIVPAGDLVKVAQSAPDGAQIGITASDDNAVRVSIGRRRFKLPQMPADDWPNRPAPPDTARLVVDAKALAATLDAVQPAIATENSRPYLCGAMLRPAGEHAVQFVATDSMVCLMRTLDVQGAAPPDLPQVIIPGDAVSAWRKAARNIDGPVDLAISDRVAELRHADGDLLTRLVDGTYPDIDRVVPTESRCRITAPRQSWHDAIAAVALMAHEFRLADESKKGGIACMAIIVEDKKVVLAGARIDGTGAAAVPLDDAHVDGDDVVLAMRPRHALTAIDGLPAGDTVTVRYVDNANPVRVQLGHDTAPYWRMSDRTDVALVPQLRLEPAKAKDWHRSAEG